MCWKQRLSSPVIVHREKSEYFCDSDFVILVWYNSIPKHLFYPGSQNYFRGIRKSSYNLNGSLFPFFFGSCFFVEMR